MTGPRPSASGAASLFMVDPAVVVPDGGVEVPFEAVAGTWDVRPDGSPGRFRVNPHYEPAGPDSPSDPVDLVLRRLGRDGTDGDDLLDALAEIDLDVAVDGDGSALVAPAPDGVPCVLTTTAPLHRPVVEDLAEDAAAGGDVAPVAGWRGFGPDELASVLVGTGIDVLLNPWGPAPMRLGVDALHDAAERAWSLARVLDRAGGPPAAPRARRSGADRRGHRKDR